MITTKPTKNLTGVTIQGDFNDFCKLVDSIHRITGVEESSSDFYFGVKNRLLGVCYDIRHAYMGDRDIVLRDNGITTETMDWHSIIVPTQNVYYSVNILFPEAIFVAAATPNIYLYAHLNYGMRGKTIAQKRSIPYFLHSDYMRDKANIDALCAGIWQALGEVIGDEELEKISILLERTGEDFANYATHYIDKCNIELLKTAVEKRKDKLRNIAKRIMKKPGGYMSLEADLKYSAKKYKTTIYDLEDPRIEYPEEIEW